MAFGNRIDTLVNTQIGSDSVTRAVQVIQSSLVERLSGYYVDAGIIHTLGENEHGQINASHQNASVELFLPLRCSSEVEGSRDVRRAI